VALGGIVVVLTGNDDPPANTAGTEVAGITTVAPAPTTEPPTSAPATTEATTTTVVTDGLPVFPEPVTLSGTGSQSTQLPSMAADVVLEVTHSGTGSFAVTLAAGPVVNVVGAYNGRVWAGFPDAVNPVQVNADGAWTITVRPVLTLGTTVGPISGSGDDVVILPAAGITADVNNSGVGTFSITTYGSVQELVISHQGSYAGPAIFQGEVLEIRSDGPWTITPR
jgi:hypothetical protein